MNIYQLEFLKVVTNAGIIVFLIGTFIALVSHITDTSQETMTWLFVFLVISAGFIACHYLLLGATV